MFWYINKIIERVIPAMQPLYLQAVLSANYYKKL
jgi:hypothetical protein